MKKSLFTFLSFLLLFSLFSANAGATATNTQYVDEIHNIQNELINSLQNEGIKNIETANEAIDSFFKNNPVDESLLTEYFVNTNQKTVLPETENDSDDFQYYLKENVDSGKFKEYNISDNIKITLTDSPFFVVESVTADANEEESSKDTLTSENTARVAASKSTPTETYTLQVKSILGNTAFSVSVRGYFTYNGSAVNPHLVDAWYNIGSLTTWQVNNWQKGVTYETNGKVRIYGKGNFRWGISINGHGLTIQDKYINVFQEGDKDGGRLWDRIVN